MSERDVFGRQEIKYYTSDKFRESLQEFNQRCVNLFDIGPSVSDIRLYLKVEHRIVATGIGDSIEKNNQSSCHLTNKIIVLRWFRFLNVVRAYHTNWCVIGFMCWCWTGRKLKWSYFLPLLQSWVRLRARLWSRDTRSITSETQCTSQPAISHLILPQVATLYTETVVPHTLQTSVPVMIIILQLWVSQHGLKS